jgi:hypothetical protein
MSNCEQKENTEILRAVLNELWLNEVMKTTVLFLKFNEQGGNDLHGSITDLVQGVHLQMHY